ncbi:MAG: hypothetical protein KAT68_16885 [Bacteroidales bacterium]|nr:hypothetical protein [Bacteroidales bacterium]
MNKFYITFLLIILSATSYGQNNITARLTITHGHGNVNFIFNTLNKYNTGLTLTNWTKFHVYYNDTIAGPLVNGNGWQLDFKSMTVNIEGATGLTLPTQTVEIEASGSNGTITYNTWTALTAADQTIVLAPVQTGGGTPYSEDVFISYNCGKNDSGSGVSVWSKQPDYYVVDILFTLLARP